MTVKRFVADIAADNVAEVQAFSQNLFNISPVMDQGWIVTLSSGETAKVQISIASEGESGTPVPDLSIEVEDVDDVFTRALAMGVEVAYPLTNEPWGVRRFFARDPAGRVLNIPAHAA